jgi:hypothetical protein
MQENWKRFLETMAHSNISHKSQQVKQPINRQNVLCTYNGVFLSLKGNSDRMLHRWTWEQLPEINQSQKRQIPCNHTWVSYLKYSTPEAQNENILFNEYRFRLAKRKKYGDWLHSTVDIPNTELYTQNRQGSKFICILQACFFFCFRCL